jgi:hypothetical protein
MFLDEDTISLLRKRPGPQNIFFVPENRLPRETVKTHT